jgi:dATP pyrophosphohydrolase
VPQAVPVLLSSREHTAWQWLEWHAAADRCYSASNAEAILMLTKFGQTNI